MPRRGDHDYCLCVAEPRRRGELARTALHGQIRREQTSITYEFPASHFATVKGYDAYAQQARSPQRAGLEGAVEGLMKAAAGAPGRILRELEARLGDRRCRAERSIPVSAASLGPGGGVTAAVCQGGLACLKTLFSSCRPRAADRFQQTKDRYPPWLRRAAALSSCPARTRGSGEGATLACRREIFDSKDAWSGSEEGGARRGRGARRGQAMAAAKLVIASMPSPRPVAMQI